MSFDNNSADWSSSNLDQSLANHSHAKSSLSGGDLLSSPPTELEASIRRRNSLLKSMDLLNTLVLDDFDLSDKS